MSKRRREPQEHIAMAFWIAAIFACGVVGVVEDTYYFATDVVFWNTWRLHPASMFAGTLAFLGLLYFLQRMHNREHALRYLEPYIPLLVLSSANLLLKLNGAWLFPVAFACALWSMAQVRRLRDRKSAARRLSASK
jgi:hypothetical protein